jgi:hypothetical protein
MQAYEKKATNMFNKITDEKMDVFYELITTDTQMPFTDYKVGVCNVLQKIAAHLKYLKHIEVDRRGGPEMVVTYNAE